MMNETNEMRAARHGLQMLSASDPAAASNMYRYVVALAIMVAGRRGRNRLEGEPQFGAGFQLTTGEQNLMAAAAMRSGEDSICLAFDIDDAAGPLMGLGVFRAEGKEMACYRMCQLWSPTNGGRALIVPSRSGDHGYFAFRPREGLRHIAAPPLGDLEAGFRRGISRLTRIATSNELRDADRVGFMHRLHNDGQEIYVDTKRLAA